MNQDRSEKIGGGYTLVDLPCGCQDVVDSTGTAVDREHDHVECDGETKITEEKP